MPKSVAINSVRWAGGLAAIREKASMRFFSMKQNRKVSALATTATSRFW